MWLIISKLTYFRISIFISVTLTTTLLTTLFLYWMPVYTENQRLLVEINEKRGNIVHFLKLNEFSKGHADLKKEVDTFDQKLKNNQSHSDLSEVIGKIAEKHHIRVISETNKERKSKTDIKPMVKSMLIEGSYKNMRRYLHALGKIEAMVFIDRLDMKNKEKSRLVKTSVKLVVYTRQD